MYHIKADKRNRASCRLLYEALARLLQKKPYEQISISELVDTAGVGRATFYRSFDSIDDILKYQTDLAMQGLFASISTRLLKNRYFSDEILFLWFFEYWQAQQQVALVLVYAGRYRFFEESFRHLFLTNLGFLKDLVGFSQDYWPYFIRLRVAMLAGMLEEWLAGSARLSPAELVQVMLETTARVEFDTSQVAGRFLHL